ncbi:MAG: hypothetical protein WCZ89_03415 [Phycisphaerae bacterium]
MQAISLAKSNNFQKKDKLFLVLIIKGFMGEPIALKCLNKDDNFVTLLGKSGKTQIKLKVKYAYYDAETYQRLQNAFNSSNKELLEAEWQKAKPIC